jgi:ribosomal protein S27AE
VRNRRNGYREHTKYLRMALDEIGRKRICVTCGVGETWQGYPLVLEIDHRNGDPLDNRETNLEYRCPNCHSQIPNHSKRSLK